MSSLRGGSGSGGRRSRSTSRGRGRSGAMIISSPPSTADQRPDATDLDDQETLRVSAQGSQTGSTGSVNEMSIYRTCGG